MTSLSQLYQEALDFEAANKIEEAISKLYQAVALIEESHSDTLTFNIFYHLGLNAGAIEDYDTSISAYKKAIEICPDRSKLWLPHYGLGFIYSVMDNLSAAIHPYKEAIELCDEALPCYYAHMEIADAYHEAHDIDSMILHREAALQIAKDNDIFLELMNVIYELSNNYLEFDLDEEGRDLLKFGLSEARKNQEQEWEKLFLGNLSTAYLGTSEWELSKKLSEELLLIAEDSKVIDDKTTALNNLAMYHRSQGEYDQGVEYLEEAIKIETDVISKAIVMRNLSSFHEEVGDIDTALHHLILALEIVEQEKHWEKIIKYRSHAADLYFAKEHYSKSIEFYQGALEAFGHYPEGEMIIELLTHIGSCWSRLDEFDKAIEFIDQALMKSQEIKTSDRVLSITYNALAGIYLREDYFDEAKKYYDLSLALDDNPEDNVFQFNMGAFYHLIGEYDTAEKLIRRAIKSSETQRAKLLGFDRKLYDNKSGNLYEYLASIHARKGAALEALESIEYLRSRAILEDVGFQQSVDLQRFVKTMADDAAILYYANTLHNEPLVICITKNRLETVFLSLEELRASLSEFETKVDRFWDRIRASFEDGATYAKANIPTPGWFDLLLLYYRHRLLQDPRMWHSKRKETSRFAQKIYDHLILPVSEFLGDIYRLTIIPDRSLHLIPFETLIDKEGKYLIETMAVDYLPNLSIRAVLNNRSYTFEQIGLAIGIQHYQAFKASDVDLISDFTNLPSLRAEVKSASRKAEPLDGFYQSIGIHSWPDLPAIGKELSFLEETMKMVVVDEEKITPDWIRTNAKKGHLKQYRILHFANHGISVPAIPELSALVMKGDATLNRYLTMQDVVGLDIEAELVFLSACETGLGEIIPSIGVTGLSQAFLMAGAKSVLVSLWEIHDEISVEIVQCFYQSLMETQWDYTEALAVTKRKCITGELGQDLKNPLYWASLIQIG